RLAAELAHADIEGNAGTRRRLLEDHRQHLAGQRLVGLARLQPVLARARIVENRPQLARRNVGKIGEMPERPAHHAPPAPLAEASLPAAVRIRSMPSRISSTVTVSGGSSLTTLSPAGTARKCSSRSAALTVVFGILHLSPNIRPVPRTSSKTDGNSSTTEASACLAASALSWTD